jgi:hypothetical protein
MPDPLRPPRPSAGNGSEFIRYFSVSSIKDCRYVEIANFVSLLLLNKEYIEVSVICFLVYSLVICIRCQCCPGPLSEHRQNESQPPLELVIGILYGLTGGVHVTANDLMQRRPALDFSQRGACQSCWREIEGGPLLRG